MMPVRPDLDTRGVCREEGTSGDGFRAPKMRHTRSTIPEITSRPCSKHTFEWPLEELF